jgi:hypothetical protein
MKNVILVIIAFLLSNFVHGQTITSNKIICSEKEQKIQGSSDPRLIKTCTWLNYKCISTGEADYKGRYFYSYQWLKLTNGKFVKIDNAQLFNEKLSQLLEKINKNIKTNFDDLSKDSENKDCLSEIEKLPVYNINDLDIFIDKDGFTFSYSFGLSMACLAIDGDYISFSLNEIEPFLKK